MQDKTEAPTPKRLQEARRRGQVSRSQDLSGVMVLLGGVLLLRFMGGRMTDGITGAMTGAFTTLDSHDLTVNALTRDSSQALWLLAQILLPFLLALALIAVAANVLQSVPVLTLHPLKPQGQRINPAANAKRIVGKDGLMALARSLLKVGVVGAVVFVAIRARQEEFLTLGEQTTAAGAAHLARMAFDVVLTGGAALLAVGVLDYLWQRRRFLQQLRMSKQEVQDELRQTEGDPTVKGRFRQMRRSFFNRMMANVPKATVVITNPTHLAVALRYDPVEMEAPVVVAKGERLMAQRIKQIAQEHHIPIWEDKPLARALYRGAPLNRPIPSHLFQAVAEVMAFLFRLRAGLPGRPPRPHWDLEPERAA